MAQEGSSPRLRSGMTAVKIGVLIGAPLALFSLLLLVPQLDVVFQSRTARG